MLRRAALAWVLALAPVSSHAGEEVVDGIAAQVGKEIVLVSEVMQMAAPVEARLREQGAPARAYDQVRSSN